VRHFREFGLGKTGQMESIILKEVEALSDFFSNAISKSCVGEFKKYWGISKNIIYIGRHLVGLSNKFMPI
jgi:hypothetical protein